MKKKINILKKAATLFMAAILIVASVAQLYKMGIVSAADVDFPDITGDLNAAMLDEAETGPFIPVADIINVPVLDITASAMISVSHVKGRSGETVTVAIDIKENPGLAGLQLEIGYDPLLILESVNGVTRGPALNGLIFVGVGQETFVNNPFSVTWVGMLNDSSNGEILYITFTIPETAEAGTYPVTAAYVPTNTRDYTGALVPIVTINGSVNVMPQQGVEKATKPIANLTSGEVEKGTLLMLSTTTPDATIYYTLDGSCPCAEGARMIYTEPIQINENMSILAAAYKEGMDYSDSLILNFTVKTQSDTGVKVNGQIRTYNPGKSATVKLMQGNEEIDKIDIPVEVGSGQRDQNFEFTNVAPGTYSLVVTKDAHTKFTVRSIIVSDQNVDLTEDSRPEVRLMILRCGDLNGDGIIDDRDLTILWLTSNYFKNTTQAANPLCDFNSDGVIDDRDLTILWLTYNYYRGEIAI